MLALLCVVEELRGEDQQLDSGGIAGREGGVFRDKAHPGEFW